MATVNTLGDRRNAVQRHALAEVQRQVRATDSSGRRKYLRDFSQAFRSYDSVIDAHELAETVGAADIVLVGDYHALPTAQRFAASLLEQRAHAGDRPIVLGVETIFARHQHVLEEWWRREIGEDEFRERIRFDADWGYEWAPFYELLVTAREHGDSIYGLDCMPREDLRKIGARDRHAVDKIAEIRERHPQAAIFVLFGESHFAPSHLPRRLRERLPSERVLTVLQNADELYWRATSERQDRVEAVRVNENVVCVFNSTPLEKYESYRLYLSRCQGEAGQPDLVPTIYNFIDSLLSFLDINRYSSHNRTQPKFLVDMLPEVHSGSSDSRLRQLLTRAACEPQKIEHMLRHVEARGSVYLPSINAFYVREFRMTHAAEEAARFLHHACRGLPLRRNGRPVAEAAPSDRFYARAVEHALAYFGSRVLYPARLPERELEGWALSPRTSKRLSRDAQRGDRAQFDAAAQKLGYALGSELYDAYLRGSVSRTALRYLFLAHIEQPGQAEKTFTEILLKACTTRKKPCASAR
ncbi:MAG: ChaN family lipoprotein [Terriglobales bacterium]